MTEMERLINRLCHNPDFKLTGFHVSWGPDAHLLTPEERAAELNRAMDAVDRGEFTVLDFNDSKRKIDVREWVKSLPPS